MKVFKVLSFKEGRDLISSAEMRFFTNMYELVKLGLVEDPREGKDRYNRHIIERSLKCKEVTLFAQEISQAHHYNRYRMLFLAQNAYKAFNGAYYVLASDKAEIFMNSELHPEIKKVTISFCQNRIPKIGQEKVKYIVYRREFETEFERATRNGIVVCRKSDYKNHNHYGKYILVDVIRPEIMWGTFEEIENDIKHIILNQVQKDNLIDFLSK